MYSSKKPAATSVDATMVLHPSRASVPTALEEEEEHNRGGGKAYEENDSDDTYRICGRH